MRPSSVSVNFPSNEKIMRSIYSRRVPRTLVLKIERGTRQSKEGDFLTSSVNEKIPPFEIIIDSLCSVASVKMLIVSVAT